MIRRFLLVLTGGVVGCDHAVELAPVDGAAACAVTAPCPPSAPGQLSVCGTIVDVEDAAPPASCSGDACGLELRFFDVLDWASGPSTARPLAPSTACIDGRGRFQAVGMSEPTFGYLAIIVDDLGAVDAHVPTMVAIANQATAQPVQVYVTRNSTDAAWSQASGVQLATRGVAVVTFTHDGLPAAGVTVRRDGAVVPGDDLYFADLDHARRQLDPSRPRTGDNGTALLLDTPMPITVDGVGGEPAGCTWESALAVTVPGTVSVWARSAITASGAPCP